MSAGEGRSQRGREDVEPNVRSVSGRVVRRRLLRLTGFHDASATKTEPHDRAWQRYTAINRHTKRHYLSDASFEAVAGFCVEK